MVSSWCSWRGYKTPEISLSRVVSICLKQTTAWNYHGIIWYANIWQSWTPQWVKMYFKTSYGSTYAPRMKRKRLMSDLVKVEKSTMVSPYAMRYLGDEATWNGDILLLQRCVTNIPCCWTVKTNMKPKLCFSHDLPMIKGRMKGSHRNTNDLCSE